MNYKGTANYKARYGKYSHFKSLKEFNASIEMFLAVHKKDFTKTEFIAFQRLRKFGACVFGVATISIRRLLKEIQKNDSVEGISESTFHRMKRKAMKKGILKVVEQQGVSKRQSTNIWVFQRFQSGSGNNDTPSRAMKGKETIRKPIPGKEKAVIKPLTPLETSKPIKTNLINKRKASTGEKGTLCKKRKGKSRVPEPFRAILAAYFNDAFTIGEFWRMIKHYVQTNNANLEEEKLLGLAFRSFDRVKKLMKNGTAKNPVAIFSESFERNLQKEMVKKQFYEAERALNEELEMEKSLNKLERISRANDFYLRVEQKHSAYSEEFS